MSGASAMEDGWQIACEPRLWLWVQRGQSAPLENMNWKLVFMQVGGWSSCYQQGPEKPEVESRMSSEFTVVAL